ncbi:MAG: Rieske 2Fe-2S domain-containing protein [Candidatus Omnitrophica bacterium]|nr:Rieske 2Fe-2S domain-containing protein [Candidatus Omnitrophota bacterium]
MVVNGQRVAVFTIEGRAYAIGDRCPHRGGPLSRGTVEQAPGSGPAVRCPIHGWLFDLETGRCLNQPAASVPVCDVPRETV